MEREIDRLRGYVAKLQSLVEQSQRSNETFVTTQMNRQARMAGTNRWRDYHSMTFKACAEAHAADMAIGDCSVDVRDTSQPDLIRTFDVKQSTVYKAYGLRGAEV